MDPLSLDRIPTARPLAVESASLATGRVVPVAPVNPSTTGALPETPVPSVINLIRTADKPADGEGVYQSVSDPTRPGSQAAQGQSDWTIQKPKPEETKPPPEPPLYQLLIDHIKLLWTASASAVQVQQQVKDELNPNARSANPLTQAVQSAQAVQANEILTYLPQKTPKVEKPLT